jgi:hypothetical protein
MDLLVFGQALPQTLALQVSPELKEAIWNLLQS